MLKTFSAALLCSCFAWQAAYPQSPPVAGFTFDSLQTGAFYGQWLSFLHNTATGSPDTWTYWVTGANCSSLPCNPNFGTVSTTTYSPAAHVMANLPGAGPTKIWQVVANTFGADTTSMLIEMSCDSLATPPSLQILYDTVTLPTITAVAYANIWVNVTEITIFGPGLSSPSKHSYSPSVTDTVLVPGPVWACGYYYTSNCFSTAQFCDTIQLPCFRSPVVSLSSQTLGSQVLFTDSVIATAGATWSWDFGDGNTST